MTVSPQINESRGRIGIISGFSLAHNPRVLKEASTLAAAGFEVVVLGCGNTAQILETDLRLAERHGFTFLPVGFLNARKPWDQVLNLALRARGRLARMLHAFTDLENPHQLGNNTGALHNAARALNADYYIAHMEPAMWVGAKLLQAGCRVGIDVEDWNSEDLLPEARKLRPLRLLRSLEGGLLGKASHSTCTSKAMSAALAAEYNCPPPAVIYNAFPWSDRKKMDGQFQDRRDRSIPSIHWYSQTLGRGRGLEDLLAAIPLLKTRAEIHLRGNSAAGFKEWLYTQVPELWKGQISVHPLVSVDELLSRIAEHDIGFAGEQKYCLNRDLTVTNKILHYLLAGLAVVASDTTGQREIAGQAQGAVRLYPCGDSQALAKELNLLLTSAEELQSAKACALAAARETFCWEKQIPILLANIEKGLK